MMKFFIKYKSGATFIETRQFRNAVWLKYYVNEFRRNPLVERVLVEVI